MRRSTDLPGGTGSCGRDCDDDLTGRAEVEQPRANKRPGRHKRGAFLQSRRRPMVAEEEEVGVAGRGVVRAQPLRLGEGAVEHGAAEVTDAARHGHPPAGEEGAEGAPDRRVVRHRENGARRV